MSDHYISIVPASLEIPDAKNKAIAIKNWLVDKGIINETLEDCTLGTSGYRPGRYFQKVLTDDENNFDFVNLAVNGVAFAEERTVFHSGGNGIDEVICPLCKNNIVESNWADVADDWLKGGDGLLTCSFCNRKAPLSSYFFGTERTYPWAFSNFGITFWNWPPSFRTSFLDGIKNMIGTEVIVVMGHY
jgi:hypothetical protein